MRATRAGTFELVRQSNNEKFFTLMPNSVISVTQPLFGQAMVATQLNVDGEIFATKVSATNGFNGACGPSASNIVCNQDIAETFSTDTRTEPGDVVVFIPDDRAFPGVKLASRPNGGGIVGVVSTNPGLVFDQGQTKLAGANDTLITDKKTVVAMVGRVPVKVSLENGPIAVGDPLTSGNRPGTAMKASAAGQIIGYAMQSSAAMQDGKLLVWLQLGHWAPDGERATQAELAELKAQVAELAAAVAKLTGR